MDRQRILVVVGSVLAFVVFVAVGASAIVSLAPLEGPATATKGALLMEPTTAPHLPDESPSGRSRPEELAVEPAPPVSPRSSLAERDQAAVSQRSTRQTISPPLREPRTVLATLPPAALPPSAPTPSATAPKPNARPERHSDGVLTPIEIRRFRLALRLTREQEPYWPPVEQVLMDIGTQQAAMVRAGQDPKDIYGVGSAMRVYGAARPLLEVLREDQKAKVREQARSMGFGSIASSI